MNNKILRLLFSLFIATCAVLSLYAGTALAGKRAEEHMKLMEQGSSPAAVKQPTEEKITRPVVKYEAKDTRDPFQDYLAKKSAPGVEVKTVDQAAAIVNAMKVQGIIWGGRFPQAIIDNKVVKAGDAIGEARVVEIKKDGITLLVGDRNYTISSPGLSGLESLTDKKGGR